MIAYRLGMRRHLLPLLLLAGCAAGAGPDDRLDSGPDDGPDGSEQTDPTAPGTPADCAYPDGAVEPMALGEVVTPYRWPEARHLGDGRQLPLDLADVPCNTDPDIDWSPFDVLLFVSIPAW